MSVVIQLIDSGSGRRSDGDLGISLSSFRIELIFVYIISVY